MTSFLELDHPRAFSLHGYDKWWFDDANQHMLLVKDQKFYTASFLGPTAITVSPVVYSDDAWKPCAFAKCSLDRTLLAIQRSPTRVEIIDLAHSRDWNIDTTTTAKATKTDEESTILPQGIIWSDHGGNSQDLIILTERGVDFYKVSVKRGQCKLSRTFAHQLRHFWYNAEQRLLLLGCGLEGCDMRGYYLRFETTDLPKFELPPPDKLPRFELPCRSLLNPKDVGLVRLYGRAYCVYIDNTTFPPIVNVYRLDRDQVINSHRYHLYISGPVCIGAVDNLLCIHCPDSKVSMLYDLLWRSREADHSDPFCGAMTVGFNTQGLKSLEEILETHPPPQQQEEEGPPSQPQDTTVGDGISTSGTSSTLGRKRVAEEFYDPNVFFLVYPNWAVDKRANCVWSLCCNLSAITQSNRIGPKIVPFLMRRGRSYHPRLPGFPREEDIRIAVSAKRVLLELTRDFIVDRPLNEVLPLLHRLMQAVAKLMTSKGIRWRSEGELKGPESISAAATTTAGGEKREGERTGRPVENDNRVCPRKPGTESIPEIIRCPEGDLVILPQELVSKVFEPLLSSGSVEKSYMSLVVVQLIGILQELNIAVEPILPVLAVRLMRQAGQQEDLLQFLRFQQTALDSEQLADIIFIVARDDSQGTHSSQLVQLACDMLFRLCRFDVLIRRLLQEGLVPEALKVARQCKTYSILPDPVSAVPLGTIVDAVNRKLEHLSDRQTSLRAAHLYLLYDFLEEWDPDLFPNPSLEDQDPDNDATPTTGGRGEGSTTTSADSSTQQPKSALESNRPSSSTTSSRTTIKFNASPSSRAGGLGGRASPSARPTFANLLPEFPFGTFPDAVEQTLGALYGYSNLSGSSSSPTKSTGKSDLA